MIQHSAFTRTRAFWLFFLISLHKVKFAFGHVTFAKEVQGIAPLTRGRMKGQYKSERRLQNKDPKLDKHCKNKLDKNGITCAPSQSPSSAPSVAPSISHAPSISAMPSSIPSASPTNYPTQSPSARPTGAPSSSPTNYPTQSPSARPTGVPTSSPTSYPTQTPSARPTGIPTGQPSISPTIAPTTPQITTLQLTRADGSVWQETTCKNALPAGASTPQSPVTLFEYFLRVTPNINPNNGTALIERGVFETLAQEMTCRFNEATNMPFQIYSISSLPVDTPSNGVCPENIRISGSECYSIRAGFTPTIFYYNGSTRKQRHTRRQLQSNVPSPTESEIMRVFGPILKNLLDSDRFVGNDILGTTYSGFLVGANNNSTNGSVISAIQGNTAAAANDRNGSSKRQQSVISGVVVCLAAIALIVISFLLIQKRRRHNKNGEFEECNGSVIGSSLGDEKDAQEGFPGDNTRYLHSPDADEGIEVDEHDFPRVASRQSTKQRSLDGSESWWLPGDKDVESEMGRSSFNDLKYSVVNDESTVGSSLYGLDSNSGKNDAHDYDNCKNPSCFKCRAREMSQPTFVRADLQAIQEDLGSNKTYRPKHGRRYLSDDTVDL